MEQRLGDVPASVTVLTQEDIRRSPAVVADDVLRQIPTFSLFRRTSSLASHPTAQGVSLRGIGPSGVSRTLVLLDGVPFNDPFGGWVYWTRVPLDAADRIEVVDSVELEPLRQLRDGRRHQHRDRAAAMRRTVDVKAQYGNRNSPKVDFRASDVWGKVGVVLDGAAYSTDGYPIVVEVNPAGVAERGRVDKNASVEFRNVQPEGRVRRVGQRARVLPRRVLPRGADQRQGQHDRRHRREERHELDQSASGGVRAALGSGGELEAAVFTDFETFRSNFLAVPAATPPRSIGRMTLNQRVPSKAVGGMAQWSRAFGRASSSSPPAPTGAGSTATARRTGSMRRPARRSRSKRDLRRHAAQPRPVRPGRHHADGQPDDDAQRARRPVAQLRRAQPRDGVPERHADRQQQSRRCRSATTRSSARASRRAITCTSQVSVWGDIGAGFRAPTLNELYRQFRVGTVLTLANNQLGPERLVGGELGVSSCRGTNVMLAIDLLRQPRQGSGLERDADHGRRQRDPAAPESRQDAHPRAADRRRSPARRVLALRRRLSLRPGRGARVRGQSGARRQVPGAGAEAPRLGAGRLHQSALPGPGVHGPGARHAVRRRPERADGARALRAGPAGIRASRRSRPRAPSAATSRCSSACRTSSTRNTSSARCPRPSARRGWSPAGSGCDSRGARPGEAGQIPKSNYQVPRHFQLPTPNPND